MNQRTRKAGKEAVSSRTLSELPTNSSEEILRKVRHARNVTHHDMNNRFCQLFILISCVCAVSHSLDAQTPEPGKPTPEPGKQKEFIYVQRLVQHSYNGEKWTKEDKATSDQHFVRLLEATKSGQLILAGRTQEPGEKTFGIAIFRAADEAAARAYIKTDTLISAEADDPRAASLRSGS